MRPVTLPLSRARAIWMHAQRLTSREPFGSGPEATKAAIEQLGYVQIDTINVIERCHHHILFTRIPDYERTHLQQAQSVDKSVFEYWTHALAYVPARDVAYHLPAMRQHRREPRQWNGAVDPADYKRVIRTIRDSGPITIRDIEDEELREKDHPWASRKPSKAALQLGFWNGVLTISARTGMLKTYDLMDRHFGWEKPPRPATERQVLEHLLDRSLRAQGLVNAVSILHTHARLRSQLQSLIERRTKQRRLVPVRLEGDDKPSLWAEPQALEEMLGRVPDLVHILSPFDPLVIQRKRLSRFFGYDHIFEAYVPAARRQLGYFALPVLCGDEVVAALDLKADRTAKRLLIQKWTWVGRENPALHQARIEAELERFERFQLGN